MKKLMLAAMVAAGIVGAAEAATYKWAAQVRWYPETMSGNPWWYSIETSANGTVEAGAFRSWIGVWWDGTADGFGAVSATTYDALMAMDEMANAHMAIEVTAEAGMVKEMEAVTPANTGYSGECVLIAQVSWAGGDYYDPIPEPTSAAMVLLGLAWMALRRREGVAA